MDELQQVLRGPGPIEILGPEPFIKVCLLILELKVLLEEDQDHHQRDGGEKVCFRFSLTSSCCPRPRPRLSRTCPLLTVHHWRSSSPLGCLVISDYLRGNIFDVTEAGEHPPRDQTQTSTFRLTSCW